jgi:hypothetical protein
MAEVSPLRRRMIEDMRSSYHAWPSEPRGATRTPTSSNAPGGN